MDREDAVQDTLEEICKNLCRLQNEACFRHWCRRILIRKCQRMSKKRKAVTFVSLDEFEHNLAAAEPFFTDKMRELYSYIMQMESGLRETMILRFFHELPVKVIANIQSIPEGTVKWRVHNGRLRIQKIYSLYEGD